MAKKGLTLTLPAEEVEVLKRMAPVCIDPEDDEERHRPEIYRYLHIQGKRAEATNGHLLVRHRMAANDFEGSWLLDPKALPHEIKEDFYELRVLKAGEDLQGYPNTQSAVDQLEGLSGHVEVRLTELSRVFLTDQLLRISIHLPPEQKPWFPVRLEGGRMVLEWGAEEKALETIGMRKLEGSVRLMGYYLWLAFQVQGFIGGGMSMMVRSAEGGQYYYPQAFIGPFETFLIMPMTD